MTIYTCELPYCSIVLVSNSISCAFAHVENLLNSAVDTFALLCSFLHGTARTNSLALHDNLRVFTEWATKHTATVPHRNKKNQARQDLQGEKSLAERVVLLPHDIIFRRVWSILLCSWYTNILWRKLTMSIMPQGPCWHFFEVLLLY